MIQEDSYLQMCANYLQRSVTVTEDDAVRTSVILPKSDKMDVGGKRMGGIKIIGPVSIVNNLQSENLQTEIISKKNDKDDLKIYGPTVVSGSVTFRDDVLFENTVNFLQDVTFNKIRANNIDVEGTIKSMYLETTQEPTRSTVDPDNRGSTYIVHPTITDSQENAIGDISQETVDVENVTTNNNTNTSTVYTPRDGLVSYDYMVQDPTPKLFYNTVITTIDQLKTYLSIPTNILSEYCFYTMVFYLNEKRTCIKIQFFYKYNSSGKAIFKIYNKNEFNLNDRDSVNVSIDENKKDNMINITYKVNGSNLPMYIYGYYSII